MNVTTIEIANRLWEILEHQHGQTKAIKGKHLAARVGLTEDKNGERRVQEAIERLRKQGHPIAADELGYFIPITIGEKRRYLMSFDLRIESMCVAKSMAARAMGLPEVDQPPLFEVGAGRRTA
jgi:biotin operon repressor